MNRVARSKAVLATCARGFTVMAKPVVRAPLRTFTPAVFTAPQRYFSSQLGEALGSEIEHEESNAEVDKEFLDLKKQIEKSFKIHDTDGNGIVKLTRTHGNESIVVTFDCQDTSDEENFEEAETEEGDSEATLGFGINFEVAITKGNNKLLVNCVGGDGSITVDSIRHLPANKDSHDLETYGGPNFDDLDEKVVDGFFDYLEERQVNSDLGHFVLSYSREKEQKEYVNWLKNVQDFVSK